MTNEIKTIRESIDAYRRRIAQEGFSSDKWRNQMHFPYDNHTFAMKLSSDDIRRIFEGSGQFIFVRQSIRPEQQWHTYSWDCLPTDAFIIADCLDKGGIDRGDICQDWNLSKGWIPISIHPYQSERLDALCKNNLEEYHSFRKKLGEHATFTGAIETLEVLLSLAEKYKIPMVTKHKDNEMGHPLVIYTP